VERVSVVCAAAEPGITFAGLKEHVMPTGSGAAQEKTTPVLKLPDAGETEIANVATPPTAIDAEPGVATGALKSSPVPESATVIGLAFDPLCLMVSVPPLGPIAPGLNATVTLHVAFGGRLIGRAPHLFV
jgi:hypothetical protein